MEILEKIKDVLEEILDVDAKEITPETYIIRDLGAESIDLLEIAVELNSCFDKEIDDDDIFLRNLRLYINEAKEKQENIVNYILTKLPFLSTQRVNEMIDDLSQWPILKVKDFVSYIEWRDKT